MKRRKHDTFNRVFYAVLAIFLALGVYGIVRGAVRANAQPDDTSEAASVYIVYTDEQSHPYAVLTIPHVVELVKPEFELTEEEREAAARIVAGQAVGKSITCQTMIANVLYNQMMVTGGDMDRTEYAKYGRQAPTPDTYEAVDAIFTRGEWLLDDTVRWTGDAANPDEWHQTLRYVTECEGIAFYEVA